MKRLDVSFPTPEENLACDEALLDLAEHGEGGEILRFWEASKPFVVLGYSNKAVEEVDLEVCRKNLIPVLRRPSGGGTVLQGPGCLNYSLVLKIPETGPLTHLTETNKVILERHREALTPLLGDSIRVQGVSDLTLGNLKFSGNAQRRKKDYFLFHGTFLYEFPLDLISRFLKMPSRKPEYRKDRSHQEFVTNISLPAASIKQTIQSAWDASEPAESIPGRQMHSLIEMQYSRREWNFKF